MPGYNCLMLHANTTTTANTLILFAFYLSVTSLFKYLLYTGKGELNGLSSQPNDYQEVQIFAGCLEVTKISHNITWDELTLTRPHSSSVLLLSL